MNDDARPNKINSTRVVHDGALRVKAYNSLVDPIVQNATYTFADTNDAGFHPLAFIVTSLLSNNGNRHKIDLYLFL